MRDLNYQLKQLCRHNRDGSYATQQNRERALCLIADQLRVLGYRHLEARSLKPKHIDALIKQWQRDDISTGTITRNLTPQQRAADRAARLIISRELGHEREAVTAVYLGR